MTPNHQKISSETLKRRAKALARETGIAHHEALDEVVQTAGFTNWQHYLNTRSNRDKLRMPPMNSDDSFVVYKKLVTTRAEAWALLLQARQHLPDLTSIGLENQRDSSARGESLETCLDEIALCADWARRLRPTRSINWRHTSYNYKHRVEAWGKRRVEEGESVPAYIANGSFIAAAVGLGFRLERAGLILEAHASVPFGLKARHEPDRRSLNACFNFSEISLRTVR